MRQMFLKCKHGASLDAMTGQHSIRFTDAGRLKITSFCCERPAREYERAIFMQFDI
jgi:hypothetical protein